MGHVMTELPRFVVVSRDGVNCEVETFLFRPANGEAPTRWNISYAKQLVAAGHYRALVPIDRQTMQEIVKRNSYELRHVAEVDESIPGIAAPYLHEGQLIYILIDGVHRCVRAVGLGVPFRAYLLTDDAAAACVLEGDEWAR